MTQPTNPAWLEQHHADTKRRDKRRTRQQSTQIVASLHVAVIIGMLIAGVVIIVQLLTHPTDAIRLDMYNYTNFAKIYIVLFVVNTVSFLLYTVIDKPEKRQTKEG